MKSLRVKHLPSRVARAYDFDPHQTGCDDFETDFSHRYIALLTVNIAWNLTTWLLLL